MQTTKIPQNSKWDSRTILYILQNVPILNNRTLEEEKNVTIQPPQPLENLEQFQNSIENLICQIDIIDVIKGQF